MDQNNPNNSGFGTGTGGSTTGSGSTGTGSAFNTGGTGSGMTSGGGMSSPGSGGTGSATGGFGGGGSDLGSTGSGTSTDSGTCAHCGQSLDRAGLDQFLGRLGINGEMINNLKGQFENVDIDEYLNTARDYLKNSGSKAQTYTKENPGKVAAGVAALALGAGLIYAAVNRDKS